MIRSAASKAIGLGRATIFLAGLLVAALALWLALAAGPAGAGDCIDCDTTPPVVTSVSPAGGATNVPYSANVTATFSEVMDPSSITTSTFTLVPQGKTTPVSATVGYNNTTKTATLDPSGSLGPTTYTATVKGGEGGVTDFWGNALASDKVWSFTVPDVTPPTNVTLHSPTAGSFLRGTVSFSGTALDNVGVTKMGFFVGGFMVGQDTTVPFSYEWNSATCACAFSNGTFNVFARAWDPAGNTADSPPASVTIDNTAPNTTLSSTLADPTNQTTADFSWTGEDNLSTTENLEYSHRLDSGEWSPFSTDTSVSLAGLGGGSHTFSVKARDQAGNVDTSAAEYTWAVDAVAPTVTSTAPTGKKVSPKANVTATFSEEINADTINKKTFKLVKKGTRKAVGASISYEAAAQKATLDPTRKLKRGATYIATLTTGAKDTAGNSLAVKTVWRFKVK